MAEITADISRLLPIAATDPGCWAILLRASMVFDRSLSVTIESRASMKNT